MSDSDSEKEEEFQKSCYHAKNFSFQVVSLNNAMAFVSNTGHRCKKCDIHVHAVCFAER